MQSSPRGALLVRKSRKRYHKKVILIFFSLFILLELCEGVRGPVAGTLFAITARLNGTPTRRAMRREHKEVTRQCRLPW